MPEDRPKTKEEAIDAVGIPTAADLMGEWKHLMPRDLEKKRLIAIDLIVEGLKEPIQKLEDTISSAVVSSDNLARTILWLNVIFGIATVGGFILAAIALFK